MLLVYGGPNRLRFMSEQIYSQMRCFIVGFVHKTLKANTISWCGCLPSANLTTLPLVLTTKSYTTMEELPWLLAFKVTLHRFLCESWDFDQNCAFHLNLILQYNSKEIFNCKTFLCSLLKKNNYNKNELFLALFLQWRNMSFKPNK